MRKLALYISVASLAVSTAHAAPGVTTAKVNLRVGPGTGYNTAGSIPERAEVQLGACNEGGSWCSVTYQGKNGFVSGQYVKEADTERPGWPRSFSTDKGSEIVLYQPQITEWKEYAELSAQIATEIKVDKQAKPVFGIVSIVGKTTNDGANGQIELSDIRVTELNFSALDRKKLADLSLDIGKLIPVGTVTLPVEGLTASLADYRRTEDVKGLNTEPPIIQVSESPAILVQTDGKAVYAPVKGVDGLSFVVNTNWDLFQIDADKSLYLRDGKSWLTSQDLTATWEPVTSLPELISKLPDEENWKDARTAIPPVAFEDGNKPSVVYSDKPAELIQFKGKPTLEAVSGTQLEWVSNSENDVFFSKADKKWYVLLSGRWFSAAALEAPWTFATPDLPEDFRNIPDDAPYYTVRASVPGTSESAEARLRASIPETARVATDGSVKVDVTYSGDPKFEPIKGTSLEFAVNTNDQVIKVGDKYYVLKQGIWFVGDTPQGPFAVARSIPEDIYKIPPTSPVYNVTYVRIYQTEDDAVWFGYTMGYLGAYLAWDAIVYGTGWYYPAYWDYGWAGGFWPYYPRPMSYGVGAFYNPARGTFGRYGYAYGPYRGIAGGAAYNPITGNYVRGGGMAGPLGDRGFVAAYNPRTETAAFAHGGHNIYGSWGTASVRHGSDWVRAHGGEAPGGEEGVRWRTSGGNHGFVAGSGTGGDVYAGRDGNVYRRQAGQWQKHSDDGWSPVQKPSADDLKQRGQHFATKHPDAASSLRERHAQGQPVKQLGSRQRLVAPDHLSIDRAGREFGNRQSLGHRMEFHPEFRGGGFSRSGGRHGGLGMRRR
ncbi:SH3 domain-containing protein [Brucella thiophenivorans]|uniref:SH3 domain-containing protein n=1 Tax=Brucella thiophenivorans TaxID=571255 RepID=UPI001F3CDC91|nr:SH3 domain-containing protein [Brucella thiophenivorans]